MRLNKKTSKSKSKQQTKLSNNNSHRNDDGGVGGGSHHQARSKSILPLRSFPRAKRCVPEICQPPDCRCGGINVPAGFKPKEIPQIVLLTFDDSVNDLNREIYRRLFENGRKNPNGCPITATFYVSHEWTDYSQVQNLYAKGHEIASHSISHSFGEKFSKERWLNEINGQKEILHLYGGVDEHEIRGMRAPFLQTGGDTMFEMLNQANFSYDSSLPVYDIDPPYWPYTLDYSIAHDCMIEPCPSHSYPGFDSIRLCLKILEKKKNSFFLSLLLL
ncbi:chitin deacetylase 5-like protein [Sarcoptes scabiei]|uniref:Chitin deacetylase 5-like protein n=1 Tax=Sarcoptes scabiei TaxID=52283 RepID=A0A132AG06_SARSC|nr:chitin deacetylase 5-like protein [Sarcoptes scabiei]